MTITPMPIIVPVGHCNYNGPIPWWMSIFLSPVLFGFGMVALYLVKDIITDTWNSITEKIAFSIILIPFGLGMIALSIAVWWL